MTAPAFLRLRTEDTWEWLLPGESLQSGDLATAATALRDRSVVVLVPAERVTLLGAALPTRNRSRMLQALPFVLEERLADDVDQLHFAAGTPQTGGLLPSAVVARADMERWLQALSEAGIEPAALTVDSLCLPLDADSWSVLCEADRCTVRETAQQGWAAEPGNLDALLKAALDQGHGPPARITVYVSADARQPALPESYCAADGQPVPVAVQHTAEPALALMAGNWHRTQTIDLLQGPYRRGDESAGAWRRWRLAAGLAVVLLGTELGFTLYENQRLAAEAEHLSQQIEQTFRGAFPDARRVVDARIQMEQRLAGLRAASARGGDDQAMLALLNRVAPMLPEQPGVALNALHYRNQRLELELTAPDFRALDRLRQSLVRAGVNAELGSANTADKGVSGRLTVRGEDAT